MLPWLRDSRPGQFAGVLSLRGSTGRSGVFGENYRLLSQSR
jgi:hypothetical protein